MQWVENYLLHNDRNCGGEFIPFICICTGSKEGRFTKHSAFREALYKALFFHPIGANAATLNTPEIQVVAGPVICKLPPGDSIPVAENPDSEEGPEALNATKVAHRAGEILVQAAKGAKIKHQGVSVKRTPCVMCQ